MAKKWLTRIKEAEKRGYFTTGDRRAISSWQTCMVGEFTQKERKVLTKFFDEDFSDIPRNGSLIEKLGIKVIECVASDDISCAKRIYARIRKFVDTRMARANAS